MNSTDGALSFDAVINNTNFKRQIDEMEAKIKGLTSTAQKQGSDMEATFSKLAAVAGTAFAGVGLAGFVTQLVSVRAEFQSLDASFTTMLGSKAKANELMNQIKQSALTTPFEVKELATGAKSLLAYGIAAEDVNATMLKLGDVASGLNIPFTELTQIYGKINTQGRLFAEDINQLQGRGIPIVQELAKTYGKSTEQIKLMVEAGKIGFKDVETVIKNLTATGGMFYKSMEAQSKTLNGQISNMQDAWSNMLNALGKDSEGILSGAITGATDLINNYEKVIDAIKVLVAMYGAYKAAVIVSSVAQISMTSATTGWTVASKLQYTWLLMVEKAQKLLNGTMLANPYVLVATLLAGIVTAVVLYNRELTEAEKLQKSLNDAKQEGIKAYDQEKLKIDLLVQDINNENLSREARNKKLQELIAISPEHFNALTLETMGTRDATKALQDYLAVAEKNAQVKALTSELESATSEYTDARANKNEIGFWEKTAIRLAASGGASGMGAVPVRIDVNAEIAKGNKELNDKIAKEAASRIEGIKKQLMGLSESTDKLTSENAKDVIKTVKWYDDQIKALKDEQTNKSADKTKFNEYAAQIKQLEKEREAITGGKGSKSKEAVTYAETLEAKKKLYAAYQKWIDAYGQQSADEQFSNLLKQGQGYIDYLEKEKARLKSDIEAGKGGKDGAKNLDIVENQLLDAKTGKTQIERFGDELKDAKVNAASLTAYMVKLNEEKAKLEKSGSNSDFAIQAKGLLETENQNAIKEQKALVKSFLKEVVNTKEKEAAINKKYASIEADINSKTSELTVSQKEEALAKVKALRDRDMEEVKLENFHNLESFKKLMAGVEDHSLKGMKATKDALLVSLEDLKKLGLEGSSEFKALENDLKNVTLDIDEATIRNYERIAQMAGEIGAAMEGWGGSLAGLGALLSGVASQAGNLANTIRSVNSKDTIGTISGAASAAVNLANIVISSSQQRKEAEEAYRESISRSRQEMALFANDIILNNTNKNGNLFIKDFANRAKDATKSMVDAKVNLQKSLDALDGGRAKKGQRNAVDWKAVGNGAGSGATVGAAIGSVVPVVGTAIGAVVGGIVGGVAGLFGGKKKKDSFGGLLAEYPELISKGADGVERLNKELAQTLINNNMVDEGTKGLLQSSIEWSDQVEKASEEIKGIVNDLAGGLGDGIRNALVDAFEAGTDSAKAFQGEVEKVMESIITQMMFDAFFKESFDTLQKDMTNSLGSINGDGNVVDDLDRFNKETLPKLDQFNQQLAGVKAGMAQAGYTILEGSKSEIDKAKGLEGAIKSITSDQANLIGGQMNAIRMNQAESLMIVRQQLLHMSEIAINTRYLKSIDASLTALNKSTNNSTQFINRLNP